MRTRLFMFMSFFEVYVKQRNEINLRKCVTKGNCVCIAQRCIATMLLYKTIIHIRFFTKQAIYYFLKFLPYLCLTQERIHTSTTDNDSIPFRQGMSSIELRMSHEAFDCSMFCRIFH